jgi:hypothetical protein
MGSTSMNKLRKLASFLRWRLVPIRYLTMLLRMQWRYLFKHYPVRTLACQELGQIGYHTATPLDAKTLEDVQTLYKPRTVFVVPKEHGSPFVNLFTNEDIHKDNPVFQLVFSPKILEVVADYFGNKFVLDSIQVLYSYSTGGDVRESQHWHLDYADRKSFHAIIYLNDVSNDDDGPFVFVDKIATQKIGRSLIIRRITDDQFAKELGDINTHKFIGRAGSVVYVDPAACYHYGSRCKESRLAIFVTFSSWFPFAQPLPMIVENREKIYAAAKQVRPDLSDQLLSAMLQMG